MRAQVREVSASADPVTRTFAVKATLDAKELPALGATVTVTPQALDRSAQSVIKLPTSAFRQDGKSVAVWVFDPVSTTVKLQPVVIATADGNELVVASGLTAGMQVVSAGVHVLSPGQKVTIYKQKDSPERVNSTQAASNVIATEVPASAASGAAGK